ncbi:MAG TPA: hypothetical protein VN181_00280, partial [Thermoanaerobaculia bacterium]|nr:hypothetical protein [Thermoanaerobaculia bacterium]
MNEDPIANLIRLAGPRVRASDDRAARVRGAVHEEWLQTARRRRRTRIFAIAAAILIAIAGVTLLRPTPRTTPPAYAERAVRTDTQFATLDW